jgi:hypothetical protein
MKATYCEVWSDELRSPKDLMSEDEARRRDAKGESYCVVLGDTASPQAVIEVVPENSYLKVDFVDAEGRTHTSYGFDQVDESRLFLESVTTWSYPDGAQFEFDANKIQSFHFQPNGHTIQRVDDKSSDHIETEERVIPVDANWEPKPKFGDWKSIARYDRATPAT